jgi:RNA polymerase subunit RPABC4/transcription elongation factor Spt4
MATIRIHDDGDEVVWIDVNGEQVVEVSHDEHGWDGMIAVVDAVNAVAKAVGIRVENEQDLV